MLVGESYGVRLRDPAATEKYARLLKEVCAQLKIQVESFSSDNQADYLSLVGESSLRLYPVLEGSMFGMAEVNEALSGGFNTGPLAGASDVERNNAAIQMVLLASCQCLWGSFLLFEDFSDAERRRHVKRLILPFVVAAGALGDCVSSGPKRGVIDTDAWNRAFSDWDQARLGLVAFFEAAASYEKVGGSLGGGIEKESHEKGSHEVDISNKNGWEKFKNRVKDVEGLLNVCGRFVELMDKAKVFLG